jgi:hypothetical protein
MNLAESLNLILACRLATARLHLSGLAVALVVVLGAGVLGDEVTEQLQNLRSLCQADRSILSDEADASQAADRYDTELTGFAEIDAPGRKTSSARVVKNHRVDEPAIDDGHKNRSVLRRSLLVLKSPLTLSNADSRPSLQDFEVRLQI